MALEVLSLLSEFWYGIFGNGAIVTGVAIFLLAIILISMRADITVILIVLIPLAVGLVLNTAVSNFIELPLWIILVLFMIAGLIFAWVFIGLIKS